MNINEMIYSFVREDYQRDNFDDFLRKISFKYDVPSIHIAGTNGKTIVTSFLTNIYSKSKKYKVGTFISSSQNKKIEEMILINGEPISLEKVEGIFNEYQKLFKKYDLSHYEISVFIALSIFLKEKADLAIIETGMGGEYDATNVITPILSIITNVSLEHTDYLGVSLSEIALHKAGIIKNNIPVLIGEIKGDALDVIVDISKRKNAKITRIGETHNNSFISAGIKFDYKTYRDLEISNFSLTNIKNACTAIDAVDLLMESFPIDLVSLKEGLKTSLPAGKFEFIPGNPTFIIDGANNPDAIEKLRKDVDSLALNKETYIIFASYVDKNITVMLPEIALLGSLYLSTFPSLRARKEEDYFLYLDEYKFVEDYHEIIKDIKENHPDSLILITGSKKFASIVSEEKKNNKV